MTTEMDSDPKEAAADAFAEFVRFYDLSYADRRAEVDFYTSLLRPEHRTVLELGCGTGSIVSAIAEELLTRHGAASRAVGLDRSAAMLDRAYAKNPGIEWILGDLTCPVVQGRFDLVVCAFNTLQMLDSDTAVLRALTASRELLSPDGVFVFDLYNASFAAEAAASEAARLNRVVRSFTDIDGHLLEIREDAFEADNGESVELDWRVLDTSVNPPAQRGRLVVRLRHYSPAVVEDFVAAAGLRIVARYGDVRKARFDETRSKKQVVVCTTR